MAYNEPDQFASAAGVGSGLRVWPRTIQPKTFASGSALLAKLTPVAFNSSTEFWVVWTNGGANDTGTIRGFVWPDDVQLDAGGEVLGQVLIEGKVHYDDIVLPAGEMQANLDTALITPGADGLSLRDRGIILQGIDKVR